MTKEKGYFVKSIRIRQMDAELLGQTWDLKLLKPEWVDFNFGLQLYDNTALKNLKLRNLKKAVLRNLKMGLILIMEIIIGIGGGLGKMIRDGHHCAWAIKG
ncbi:hypothetical protein GLOIN_2v1486004, partial [Rhizophagus irregularis DAOM 181602=DAOM 197198]